MLGTRYQAVLYSFPEHNPQADVDFWWIKPMASDKREIEPQTLNLHHAPPHKNDPGRSRALYAQFADLFNVCHLHGVIHDAAILDHQSSHAFSYCFYINRLTTCFPRHAFPPSSYTVPNPPLPLSWASELLSPPCPSPSKKNVPSGPSPANQHCPPLPQLRIRLCFLSVTYPTSASHMLHSVLTSIPDDLKPLGRCSRVDTGQDWLDS